MDTKTVEIFDSPVSAETRQTKNFSRKLQINSIVIFWVWVLSFWVFERIVHNRIANVIRPQISINHYAWAKLLWSSTCIGHTYRSRIPRQVEDDHCICRSLICFRHCVEKCTSTETGQCRQMWENHWPHLVQSCSSARTVNSGLIQCGVLSPLFFVLYLSDLPETRSKPFLFADDNLSERWTIRNLNNDLSKLETFYAANRLRANPNKTEVTTFHLSNKKANRKIKVRFCGKIVTYNFTPKYLYCQGWIGQWLLNRN